MRALFLRPLMTLAVVLVCFVAADVVNGVRTDSAFREAHGARVVLFGDSHGDDVKVNGVPRFNGPAQDLVSTWMRMRALRSAEKAESEVEVVVLTVWPMKFSPVAERRLSGRNQEDGWNQNVLGKTAPLLRWQDLFRSEWPWRLRWQLLFNRLQLKHVKPLMGWTCRGPALPDGFTARPGERVVNTSWFEEAEVSRWAFAAILDLVEEAGWELVLLEHPMHHSAIKAAHPQAIADYEATMNAAAEAPDVHYLALGRDSLPNSAFFDYHHLSCAGMDYVAERLDPLLDSLLTAPGR